MPLWQRMLVTLIAMVVASLVVGLIWQEIFGFQLPSLPRGRDRRYCGGASLGVPQAGRPQVGRCAAALIPVAAWLSAESGEGPSFSRPASIRTARRLGAVRSGGPV
jgi:hypothetical protein